MEFTYDLKTGQPVEPLVGVNGRDPDALLSDELYRAYKSKRSSWAKQAVEDRDFRNNNQFTDVQTLELERRGHAAIPTNVIHPAVEQAKAMLSANRPRFTASAREGSDSKVASVITELMSYVWERSSGNVELKQAIDDYYVTGMGVLCAYVDPYGDSGHGEVCVKSIDPLNLFIDPNSSDIFCRDAAHLIIAKILTSEQLQKAYPNALELLAAAEQENSVSEVDEAGNNLVGAEKAGRSEGLDRTHRRYRALDRYSRIKAPVFSVTDPAGTLSRVLEGEEEIKAFLDSKAYLEVDAKENIKYFADYQDVLKEEQLFQQTGGQYHWAFDQNGQQQMVPGPEDQAADAERGLQTVPGSTVQIVEANMLQLLQMQLLSGQNATVDRIQRIFTVGGVPFGKYFLPIEQYPIVPMMNRHSRNPYPMSDVRFVRPIQEFINKLRSLIIAYVYSATGNKLVIPRGSHDRAELLKEWEKAGPSVIEYDADLGEVHVSGPTALPNGVFKMLAEAKQDVYDILGIYPLSQGSPEQSPDTYKGTIALDEFGQRRMKAKKDDIEECLNQLARVVVPLIQKTYTQHKIFRIARPNNKPIEIEVNGFFIDPTSGASEKFNDITVGQFDLIIVSGSTLPVNRWARMQQYLELYDRQIVDGIEVLKQSEVVDAVEVADRMNQLKQLQQALAQAQEEIKNLEGDLQTADRETVSARKRAEVEKFKTELATLSVTAKAEVDSALQAYTDTLDMEMKMAVKEAKLKAQLSAKSKTKTKASS